MFPAPSPNSALLAQLAGGGATPSTLEFHRTALSAAAKRELQNASDNQQQPPTSQPATTSNNPTSAPVKSEPRQSGPFDLHDNDAANGLFMLAQSGNNGAQNPTSVPVTQPQTSAPQAPEAQTTAAPPAASQNSSAPAAAVNGNGSPPPESARGSSETASAPSEEQEPPKPATRGKGKKNPANGTATNGRRKAEDAPTKGSAKKAKTAASSDQEESKENETNPKSKMTDEEKRKNFLERNR